MFLDCPAWLDQAGAARCGLPAEVTGQYTAGSTSGPLESARIRCPSGHWFNGPVGFLSLAGDSEHEQASAEAASLVPCDSRHTDTVHGPGGLAGETGGTRAVPGIAANRATPGGSGVPRSPGEPDRGIPRPNGAPPYYLGRPASLWITAMSRRPTCRPRASRNPEPGNGDQALATAHKDSRPSPGRMPRE
jgi:hypothetical protein